MKKRLVVGLLLACVLGVGLAAFGASPFYFEYGQEVATGTPAGDWQAGLTFAFEQTTELPCPKEHPCGGLYQYSTIAFCGDLFIGNSDVWTWLGEYYAGFEGNLRWNYLGLGLLTRIDFAPISGGWPWTSPAIESWVTDITLRLKFVDWATGWAGVNLDYDYVGGYFAMVPMFGFRIGNQSGCSWW